MPKNKNQKLTHPQFIVAVYKGERRIGYLFWHKLKHRDPRSPSLTLRISGPTSTKLACFDSYEAAELALKKATNGKFSSLEETFESKGYDLEILAFSYSF